MDYFPEHSLVRDDLVHWSFGFVVWIHIGSEQVADCVDFREYIQPDFVVADSLVYSEVYDRFVSAEVVDNPVFVGVVGNIVLVVGIVNSEHY